MIEPQQTEGELAECPSRSNCGLHTPKCRPSCEIRVALEAQRAHMIQQGYHLPKDCCIGCTEKEPCAEMIAHDKTTMVKLPSEDELLAMVKKSEVCDGNTVFVDVSVLLRLMGEKP